MHSLWERTLKSITDEFFWKFLKHFGQNLSIFDSGLYQNKNISTLDTLYISRCTDIIFTSQLLYYTTYVIPDQLE